MHDTSEHMTEEEQAHWIAIGFLCAPEDQLEGCLTVLINRAPSLSARVKERVAACLSLKTDTVQ